MKTFGSLTYRSTNSVTGGYWDLKAQPDVAMRLKRFFPRTRFAPRGAMTLDDTLEVARDLEWIMLRWPLEISAEDREHLVKRADADRDREETVLKILDGRFATKSAREPLRTPRPEQLQAADLGLTSGGTICTDELGGGKTMTSLMLLRAADSLPALCVVQNNVVEQWAEEIRAVWPELHVAILKKGAPYPLAKNGRSPDIIITNYAKLRGWGDHLAGEIQTVIFDEVQELRRAESAKYSAAWQIASKARYRFGLSNTPVHNYGDELWYEFQVINEGKLGSFAEFTKEWCKSTGGAGNRYIVQDPRALGTWLRDNGLMIGRSLEEMGIAPRKPAVPIPVPIDTDEDEFERMSADVIDLAQLLVSRDAPTKAVWRASGDFDRQLRQATGLAKAGAVANFVRMIVESQGPVLLFGWHRAVYDRWCEQLAEFNPLLITGSESAQQKHRNKMAFINGESKVLIISLWSGGGMDGLQHASSRVVFGELDWSPAIHKQAIGRLHRPGQKHEVQAYYLHSTVGSDPRMMGIHSVKRQQNDLVVNPDQDLFTPAADPAPRIRQLAGDFLRSRQADSSRAVVDAV